MRNISIDDINAAILNGGAGSLLVRVELEPASGLDGIIAPAKYAGANNATYVYEKRYLGEEKPQKVVLIDSKGSFANRVEETITEARRTGEGLLASMPHIVVKYDDESGSKTYCDSQLPHRGFDGHIRVGVHDGKSTSEAKEYIDARNSTLENLLPLFKNALAWLEDNPPHSILLPRVIPPTSDAISYRDKGYLEKGKVKKSPDKASKAMSYCQDAVESLLLTWQWDENPNQEVINTLNLLCGEVPYLGEACSVVELKVIAGGGIPEVQRDKTWTLEKGPILSGISRHNRVFAVPGTGRLEELKRAYMAANPEGKGKGKNAAKSKIRAKEAEQNFLNDWQWRSRVYCQYG